MYGHYSLRGLRAAIKAVVALAAKAGRTIRPVPLPEELARKKRQGMSARSPYGRYRSRHCAIHGGRIRLRRALGPGSYAEFSPQDLIRAERAKCNDNAHILEAL